MPDCKAPHCVELTHRQINLIVYALKDAAYNCERKNAEWKNNRPDLAELAKEHHQLADFLFRAAVGNETQVGAGQR